MDILKHFFVKLIYSIPLIFGVTLISFILMVYFGPDKTYDLLGRNPTIEEINEIRHQLGYDKSFLVRYFEYIKEILVFDFGYSDSTGEKVTSILAKTIPVSVALQLPGFILGNLLGILIALFAAMHRSTWVDKMIMSSSVVGMSISYLIVIIATQLIFCSSYGLNLFPVYGWEVNSVSDYLYYITVPTISSVFVALGYNTRFYRAVIVEETTRDHVRTAKAFGHSPRTILFKHVLRNSLVPIVTRVVFSIPFVIVGGALLLESYFGIPGVGLTAYDAITTGDLPVLKAIVVLTTLMFILVVSIVDVLYRAVDPRISLK